jgi:hypothetical protein
MMVLLVSLGGMFVCSSGAEFGDGLLILWSRYISFLSAGTGYEGSLSFWSNLGGGSLSMITAIHIRFDSARSPISPRSTYPYSFNQFSIGVGGSWSGRVQSAPSLPCGTANNEAMDAVAGVDA